MLIVCAIHFHVDCDRRTLWGSIIKQVRDVLKNLYNCCCSHDVICHHATVLSVFIRSYLCYPSASILFNRLFRCLFISSIISFTRNINHRINSRIIVKKHPTSLSGSLSIIILTYLLPLPGYNLPWSPTFTMADDFDVDQMLESMLEAPYRKDVSTHVPCPLLPPLCYHCRRNYWNVHLGRAK